LLDEPFEGLAPAVTLELFKVFDQLRKHLSIVNVEHNLDLVLALASAPKPHSWRGRPLKSLRSVTSVMGMIGQRLTAGQKMTDDSSNPIAAIP
jgi:hypothetical protein